MFRNYVKTALRNIWKNKAFSAINIIGLAIGMAACILILLFVFYERSFDNIHTKNLYRLNEVQKFEGMVSSQKVALSMFPMGPTLKNEFPEIKNYTRVRWSTKLPFSYKEKKIFLPQVFAVDSTYLEMFDFKLLKGNRSTVLQKPNNILLTASAAQKIFGQEDPIGKTVTGYLRDTLNFTVTGILEDVPQNSQFQFDALFSFSSIIKPNMMDNWGGNWLNTYLELAPNTNIAAFEKKFPAYLKKYMANGDGWKFYELFLLPLNEVHSGATEVGLDYLNYQKFDKQYTNLFFIIALIVLAIACVNFMNLSTARSAERAREVGVRKSLGAHRWQLSIQFISESIILSLFALLLAIVIVELSLSSVNNLIRRNLEFPLFSSGSLLPALILATILTGVISGLYPAGYLSSFNPVRVLKGSIQTGKNKSLLRNVLVVAQFSSAIFLMIATLFVVKQLNFMQNRDTGFNRDQVVTIPLDNFTSRKFEVLKQDLLNNSLVSAVTGAQDQLGSHLDQSGIEYKGSGKPVRELTSTRLIVDHDYLNLYKISLAAGRNFSAEPSANGREYIINESLARELLKDEPKAPVTSLLGGQFGFDTVGTIVGIARDFNFNSLHNKIETMFMYNQKDWGYRTMSIKINGAKAKESIAFIKSTWQKNCADHPFEYQFLDEHFEEVYLADTQVSRVVGILATLAIIISCLGLFGLASYSAERRVKEVGIRKVLGASVGNIATMLSVDFLKYVLIAALIAWPLAWFSIYKWLQDYAYRVNMSWWIFLLAAVLALIIALVTISFQAIKAAMANPVKSLRSE
jgi:putative ABC transport system permease protein